MFYSLLFGNRRLLLRTIPYYYAYTGNPQHANIYAYIVVFLPSKYSRHNVYERKLQTAEIIYYDGILDNDFTRFLKCQRDTNARVKT